MSSSIVSRHSLAISDPLAPAMLSHMCASVASLRTPLPMAYMSPRLYCASAVALLGGLSEEVRSVLRRKRRDVECDRHDRGDEYQDQFVHIDCLSSRFTVEAHSVASVLVKSARPLGTVATLRMTRIPTRRSGAWPCQAVHEAARALPRVAYP